MQTTVTGVSQVPLDGADAAALNQHVRKSRSLTLMIAAIVSGGILFGFYLQKGEAAVIGVPVAIGVFVSWLLLASWVRSSYREDLRGGLLHRYTGPMRIRLIRNDDGPDGVAIAGPFATRKLALASTEYVRALRAAGVPRRGWTECRGTVEATPRAGYVMRFVAEGLPAFNARPVKQPF